MEFAYKIWGVSSRSRDLQAYVIMYLEFSAGHYSQMGGRPRVCEMNGNDDYFDRLPDSLLLLIFNKLDDIKVLGRCCANCKRFNTLVLQVD